jgi:hypothetical protein
MISGVSVVEAIHHVKVMTMTMTMTLAHFELRQRFFPLVVAKTTA